MERADFLMLARRAKGQKPCPVLSFQNAEQGFSEFQFNCAKKLREHAAFYPRLETAARAVRVSWEWRQAPERSQEQQRVQKRRRCPSESQGSR
jgi:hypothetical protein